MKTIREQRICVICETRSSKAPWVICQQCGDFIIHNWNKKDYLV
jgi:hypothetical protein